MFTHEIVTAMRNYIRQQGVSRELGSLMSQAADRLESQAQEITDLRTTWTPPEDSDASI